MLAAIATTLAVAAAVPQDTRSRIKLGPLLADQLGQQTKLHMQKLLALKVDAHKKAPIPYQSIFGTYVTPCEDFDCIVEGTDGKPFGYIKCSSVAVERIDMANKVETDLTVYVNDYGCIPNKTEVLTKMVIRSNISYHGVSNLPTNKRGQKIEYAPTSVTATFNFQSEEFGLIAEMNKECPCSGQWHANTQRTIRPGECTKYDPYRANTTESGDLCNFVAGESMFQTIKWINYTDYVQSTGAFDKIQGWSESLDSSLVNSQLPASGATDPSDCTYDVWPACKVPVQEAAARCDSCVGLECERCIWYFFNAKVGRDKEWGECCPCLYYEAKTTNSPWLKVNC